MERTKLIDYYVLLWKLHSTILNMFQNIQQEIFTNKFNYINILKLRKRTSFANSVGWWENLFIFCVLNTVESPGNSPHSAENHFLLRIFLEKLWFLKVQWFYGKFQTDVDMIFLEGMTITIFNWIVTKLAKWLYLENHTKYFSIHWQHVTKICFQK